MLHVPDKHRITSGPLSSQRGAGNFGAFLLPSPAGGGWWLALICDDGADPDSPTGWEHVSVRACERERDRSRLPTWTEMAYVKDLCWADEDVVVQFHPRKSEYVNQHPHVLHLWRHRVMVFPTPPPILVGQQTEG